MCSVVFELYPYSCLGILNTASKFYFVFFLSHQLIRSITFYSYLCIINWPSLFIWQWCNVRVLLFWCFKSPGYRYCITMFCVSVMRVQSSHACLKRRWMCSSIFNGLIRCNEASIHFCNITIITWKYLSIPSLSLNRDQQEAVLLLDHKKVKIWSVFVTVFTYID